MYYNSLSNTYIFADTIKNKSYLKKDSLESDSNYLPRTSSAIKSKVNYKAKDSIVYSSEEKTATLYHTAEIEFEDLNMKSAKIKINLVKNSVNAVGELDSSGKKINTPIFKQGDAEYKIEEVTFNYETKRGYMKEFKTQENDGFIKGDKVKRDEFNNFYLQDSYYTTCNDEHPHFYIEAKKLKVVPGKQVITGPANMVIEGVRTPLFVPFGIFPLKRGQQSGIIIPAYGNTASRGFSLRQGGYYLGLGEHLDMAILGDIYANLSWMLGTRINYSKRYYFNGNFSANYALNKDGLPEDKDYKKFTTFNITWSHNMDSRARPGTTFRADVNLVGNQYLALNTYMPSTNTAFNNNINSSIAFGKSFNKGKINLNTNARASQNTLTRDMSVTLPDLTVSVASFQPFKPKWKATADHWYEKISVNYQALFQNQLVTKDSSLFKSRSAQDLKFYLDSVNKNGAKHTTSAQTSFSLFKYYTVSVGADYSENWTFKTIRKDWDSTTKKVVERNVNEFGRFYQYSVRGSVNTRFYGTLLFKKGRLKAIRHVINPDAGFSYVPDFGKPNYGFYRKYQIDSLGHTADYTIYDRSLYGGPGRGRQGNINFGVDNNIEIKWTKGKDTSEKVEKIKIFESLRIGGSYNIFADSLKLSTLPVSFRTTLFKNIALNGSGIIDPYVNEAVTTNGYITHIRINKLYLSEDKKLGIVTNGSMGITASFNPEMFKPKDKSRAEALKKEMQQQGFSEVKIPWTLSVSYTLTYGKYNAAGHQYSQNLIFNGSINPTKNWFVNFNSGYDFTQKKLSHLGVDLRRDLHCWQFTFAWTPLSAFGNQYFLFNINVKSSTLKDLKYPKRKDWFDNRKI